jgi:hypothetical protein
MCTAVRKMNAVQIVDGFWFAYCAKYTPQASPSSVTKVSCEPSFA